MVTDKIFERARKVLREKTVMSLRLRKMLTNLMPQSKQVMRGMVDQVAEEVEGDYALPSLTRAEINLGRFSLAKVCISDTASIDIYSCLDSSGILQNESAIVQ